MAATSKIEKLFRPTSSKQVMIKLPVNYIKLCFVFFSQTNTSPFVINKLNSSGTILLSMSVQQKQDLN